MPASSTPPTRARRAPRVGLEAQQVTEPLPLGPVVAPAPQHVAEHLAGAGARVPLERLLAAGRERLAALDEPLAQLGDGEAREVLEAHAGAMLVERAAARNRGRGRGRRPPSGPACGARRLAPRAVEGRALRLHDAGDGGAVAARTWLPLARVDEERVLPALLDVLDLLPLLARERLPHRLEDRRGEAVHLGAGERWRRTAWVNPRPEAGLAREDVADPASTAWSMIRTFTGRRERASSAASRSRSIPSASGSGPSACSSGTASKRAPGTTRSRPKSRRSSRWSVAPSSSASRAREKRGAGSPCRRRTHLPVIPRWASTPSGAPFFESVTRSCLPWRPTASTRVPCTARANARGVEGRKT